MSTFVNISNHPSSKWSKEQLDLAHRMGAEKIIDIPFPNIPPDALKEDVKKIAYDVVSEAYKVQGFEPEELNFALVQGEMTATFAIAQRFIELDAETGIGFMPIAACSERNVIEKQLEDGTTKKEVVFKFVRFREY